MNYNNFGLAVLVHRKMKRMSQSELSNHSGISRNYISMIERGVVSNVSVEVVLNLAMALHISAYVLLEALLGNGREKTP